MKKPIYLIFAVAALISAGSGCKKQRNNKSDDSKNECLPTIDLPLDGNCLDVSVNKNTVKIYGNPKPAPDRFGNPNKAMEFNGSEDFLELPHIAGYSGNSLLLTAWVYPKAFGTYDNGVMPLSDYSGVFNKWDHTSRKGFSTYATDKQTRINGHLGDNSFYDLGSSKGTFLQTNQWQHIAYEICSGKVRLYLNGNVIAEIEIANSRGLLTVSAPFEIGRTQWYPSNSRMISYFTGALDDIKIYYNCCNIKVMDLYQAKP